MKKICQNLLIFSLLPLSQLYALQWDIKNINFQTENDKDADKDEDYSYGASLSLLFLRNDSQDSKLHIPFTRYKESDNYISFAYTHQIYTPKEIELYALQSQDRPYAGYSYFQTGLYQSYNNNLKSLTLQVGCVGSSSGMKGLQNFTHKIIGSPHVNGWANQLKNELTVQLNYSEKQYYNIDNIFGFNNDASIIPQYGINLGNVSTKIYTEVLFRYGLNVSKDYGSSSIDNTTYNKIALVSSNDCKNNNKWKFFINLSTRVNLIGRNIFLDGNTNRDSHKVDKNNLVIKGSYGISMAYNQFSIDYIRTHTSKEYKTQEETFSYGSLLFSYNY